MVQEKMALLCTFKPDKLKSTTEMRELFTGSYNRFIEMNTLEFKCWWVDEEKGEWGALYIFESEKALNDYINSEIWQKLVPEKYGCKPSWRIVRPGPIISKKELTICDKSWISD